MTARPVSRIRRWLPGWLAIGVCVSVAILCWLGYRAMTGWERSARLLADRRANQAADLLLTALSRDMRGVQHQVLSSPYWDAFLADPSADITTLVAGAFARYPYPESFFAWRGEPRPNGVLLFTRSDRKPTWLPEEALPEEALQDRPAPDRPTPDKAMPQGATPSDGGGLLSGTGAINASQFPVAIRRDPLIARMLVDRIEKDAALGRRFSVFETRIGGVPYQVIARLVYGDAFREKLEAAFGFTVNLPWVREHYFPELTRQVARIAADPDLGVSVVDDHGEPVVGSPGAAAANMIVRRDFPLTFFDPWLVALDPPQDLSRASWNVQVRMDTDATLSATIAGVNRTLIFSAAAASVLALGLVLTARAVRESERLTELRSEFVSTVTHELKTPIATIRAAGDTIVRGRITSAEGLREYAELVVQEAKRLGRLVDNLLAYARITDVTELYHFDAIDVRALVDDATQEFGAQLTADKFEVVIEIPPDLPSVWGDPAALKLVLRNLIDNAIRYSGQSRWLRIAAEIAPGAQAAQGARGAQGAEASRVAIAVSDRGIGIPEDERDQVTRRFFRGRRTTAGSATPEIAVDGAGTGGSATAGSGLGLAIVQRIIMDHSGTLSIRGNTPAGTTVTIVLPVETSEHEETHPGR
jgi:signal transduction histidine kinase